MRGNENRRNALVAIAIGFLVSLTILIGTAALYSIATKRTLPSLVEANGTSVASIGQTVADQMARALGYGIPLDQLHGVEAYFDRLINSSPALDGIALTSVDGETLFLAGELAEEVTFPVNSDGADRALLLLSTAPPLVGAVSDRLWFALGTNAVLAGLIAGSTAFVFMIRHQGQSRRRLQSQLIGYREDRFPVPPASVSGGAVARAFSAADAALAPLREAARDLGDAVAMVRAIDFDGTLSAQVKSIIKPVETTLSVAHTDRVDGDAGYVTRTGAAWGLVFLVGLYAASMPFVANFAVDRQSNVIPPAFWPVAPLLIEIALGLAGIGISRNLPSWYRPAAAASGLVVCGLAFFLVYGTRDYLVFLQYRGLAALGFGFAVGALVGQHQDWRSWPWISALLAVGLVAGPSLGGLLGEAVGRRATFLTIGAAFVLAAILPLLLQPVHSPAPPVDRARSRPPMLFALASGSSMGALFFVWMPVHLGYENYLIDGLCVGLAGLSATLFRIPIRALSTGLLCFGLASIGLFGDLPVALIGGLIAVGLAIRGLIDPGPVGQLPAQWVYVVLGLGLGGVLIGMAEALGANALISTAALCTALCLVGLGLERTAASATQTQGAQSPDAQAPVRKGER